MARDYDTWEQAPLLKSNTPRSGSSSSEYSNSSDVSIPGRLSATPVNVDEWMDDYGSNNEYKTDPGPTPHHTRRTHATPQPTPQPTLQPTQCYTWLPV